MIGDHRRDLRPVSRRQSADLEMDEIDFATARDMSLIRCLLLLAGTLPAFACFRCVISIETSSRADGR